MDIRTSQHALQLTLACCLSTGLARAATFDVHHWPDQTLVGQIDSFATAQTGQQYYNYSSSSGHPADVNVADSHVNFWLHENTATPGVYSLGVIFGADNTPAGSRTARMFVRVLDSATASTFEFIDDPNAANDQIAEIAPENWETTFTYDSNSDGFVLGNLSGSNWTIALRAESVVGADSLFAASNQVGGFTDDLTLNFLDQYRITPAGSTASGEPLIYTPEPTSGVTLCGLMATIVALNPRGVRSRRDRLDRPSRTLMTLFI
ncbi:MAG: hypothetical protein KDA42_09970 [Planctomycetales bacterium]|nr:hypothetical protein [Planctomycetales bacterium]